MRRKRAQDAWVGWTEEDVQQELAPWPTVGACTTGTCHDDPIPPGFYWLDVPWEDSQFTGVPKPQHFQLWLDSMRSLGWVGLIRTVHHEGTGVIDYAQGVDEPARDWYLFEVKSPAPRWSNETGLGLPTVAPRGADTQEGDTAYNEPTPSPIDEVFGNDGIPGWALVAAGAAGVLAILYALK